MTEQIAGLEAARFDALAKKVRITSQRSKTTKDLLKTHIDECARLQTWGVRIAIFTAAWLVAHSPEAATALVKILELVK